MHGQSTASLCVYSFARNSLPFFFYVFYVHWVINFETFICEFVYGNFSGLSQNAYFIKLAKNKALAYDPFAKLSEAEHSCARFVCGRNVANKREKKGRVAKQFAKTFIKSQRKLCKVRQSAANRVENYFCAQLTANLLINHRQQSIISL